MKFSEIVEKLSDAAECSSLRVNKDLNPEITGVAPIDEASTSTLSYIEGAKFAGMVAKTGASALVLPLDEALQVQATQRVWLGLAHLSHECCLPKRSHSSINPSIQHQKSIPLL
jgi:UDP-3-O-[3-hydroxymyristoyl] glucosamine N-acyltransferase